MVSAFRRKRRFEIEYIESVKRFCYVIDFKGKSIDRDLIALAYLRASKDALLFYVGTGTHARMPTGNRDNERAPFIVHENEREPILGSTMLRLVEEIHCAAERLYDAYVAQVNTQGRSLMDTDWRFR
jgi:hypothetical protein